MLDVVLAASSRVKYETDDAGGEVLPDPVADAGVEHEPALNGVVDVRRSGLEVPLELEPIAERRASSIEMRR